jgi:hypothetical protein
VGEMASPNWAPVELSAAIGQIRQQLANAMDEGKESPMAFRPGPVELELEVAFSAVGGGEVGVRAWVLSAGIKGEMSRSTTNRLKVTLTPVARDGGDTLISSVGDK